MTLPGSVQPSGSAGPPASRSGCGRGCLIVLILTIALLVGGVLALRPMLRERWAAWRAENPWVDQVPGIAATVREMAGGADGGEGTGSDTAGRRAASTPREGVDDKSAMPADLPLWPRPRAETFNAGSDHAAAYQRVAAAPDSVLRYFRRAMPERGWRLDREREGAGGVLLLYRKGGRLARVEVIADSAGTDIWLRSRVGDGPSTP